MCIQPACRGHLLCARHSEGNLHLVGEMRQTPDPHRSCGVRLCGVRLRAQWKEHWPGVRRSGCVFWFFLPPGSATLGKSPNFSSSSSVESEQCPAFSDRLIKVGCCHHRVTRMLIAGHISGLNILIV